MAISIGNITIDGTFRGARHVQRQYERIYQQQGWSAIYEAQVRDLIWGIFKSETGSAVRSMLQRRQVRVMPLSDPHDRNSYGGGSADPNAFGSGDWMWNCAERGNHTIPQRMGTGLGIDVTILFTPGTWISGDVLYSGINGPGSSPYEVLLHEFVHAVRQTNGLESCQPMSRGMDNIEEFCSVLVSNMYSSELHSTLRSSHAGHVALRNVDPETFYHSYSGEISALCQSMPGFTRLLAEVHCSFNPIWVHYNPGLNPSQRPPIALIPKNRY